jgi:hypothetical protein
VADGVRVAIAEHLVATTREGDRSLTWPERAGWLWARLRAGLPEALSCVVMPDHVHLVVLPGRRLRLQHILGGFTARFGVRFDVMTPQSAHSVAIAGRMIRYGFFNPPRARLTDDPFAWPWSTLRDLVGASEPIWTPLSSVASTLRLSAEATLRGLTTIRGAMSSRPRPTPILSTSVEAVLQAARSVLRETQPAGISTTLRRLVVQASFEIGSPRVGRLATALRCSVRSIHRDRGARHPAVDAVLLALGDARLIVGPLDLHHDWTVHAGTGSARSA